MDEVDPEIRVLQGEIIFDLEPVLPRAETVAFGNKAFVAVDDLGNGAGFGVVKPTAGVRGWEMVDKQVCRTDLGLAHYIDFWADRCGASVAILGHKCSSSL